MAGTINLANVALGFDASKITRGVDLTAGEMRKLNGIFQGSISNVDKYNAEMQILDKARKTGALTADRLVQSEESLARKYGLLTQAIEKANIAKKHELDLHRQRASMQSGGIAGVSGFGTELLSGIGMSKFTGGGPAAAVAALGAGSAILKQSVDLEASAQSAKISFEVLTGSAMKANSLISGMRKLDAESPLSFASLQQGTKTMLGYGVAAERIIPTLRQLGDISMGDADKFQSLSLAFGQTNAAGRLMGQEVLQMINAGFNPLQQISKDTGLSMVELKKRMEDGAISAQMVADALKNATTQGGMFHGMTQRISMETYEGAKAKLANEISKSKTMLGEMALPFAQFGLTFFAQEATRNNQALKSMLDYYGTPKSELLHGPIEKANKPSGDIFKNNNSTKVTDEMKKQQELQEKLLNSDRSRFYSQVKSIQEEYQKKMMGEQQYGELQLRNAMRYEQMTDKERKLLDDALKMRTKLSDIEKFEHNKKVEKDFVTEKNKIIGDLKDREAKIRDDSKDGLNVSKTIAPALKAGSVEAYKFMLNQKDKLADIAERQEKLMDEANRLSQKHITIAENQAVLRLKR
jgi:tape measure domain-containing protein